MRISDTDRAARLMQLLAGVFDMYRADLSKFQARMWIELLEPFETDAIESAFKAHLMDPDGGQFLPKVADIVKQLQGTKADRSALAWAKVLEATQRVGAYATVAFDDPAIHCALEDLGGWPTVCHTKIDELPFLESRFHKSYQAHAKAGSPHPPKLLGLHDQGNGLRGFAAQRVTFIGNPSKAAEVLASGSQTTRTAIGLAAAIPQLSGPSHAH